MTSFPRGSKAATHTARLALGALLALALSTCCKQGGGGLGSSSGEPQIQTQTGVTSTDPSAATVDFGSVPIGQTSTIALALDNTGEASLTINSVDQTGLDPEFTVDIAEGVVVQSGVPLSIPIHFAPFTAGAKTGTVVLHTDSSDVPTVTLTLQGTGVKLQVTVTPEGIDFGKVVIHTTATQNVTIANASTLGVTLTVSALGGAQGALFSLGSLASTSLAGGQTVELPVSYSPTQVASAPDTAYFTVTYCTGCAGVTVNLRGEPVDTGLSVTPNPLAFGFDPPNQSLTQVIKLSNVANRIIHMTAAPLVNPGSPAAFSLAQSAPAFPLTLQPNSTTDVPLVFDPPALGQYTGSITFTSDDPQASEVVVSLTGIGGGPVIQCLPGSLAFGNTAVGVPVTQSVLCTNVGLDVPGVPSATLQITTLDVPGDPAFSAHFDAPFPPAGLSAGGSALIDVVYQAVTTAGDMANLNIVSNDNQTPTTVVPLSGTGLSLPPCDFVLVPQGGLSFGHVDVGQTAQLQFAIENQGSADCLVNGLALASTSDPSYSLPGSPAASTVLGFPGNANGVASSLAVTVQFAPTGYGTPAGDVTFSISNPTDPQQDVHLTGSSQPGCLLVAPNNLDFGVVGVNPTTKAWCESAARNFQAYNTCNYDIHISSITVNAGITGAPDGGNVFVLSGQPASYPVDVPAGATPVSFQVSFQPTEQGTDLGSLSIATLEAPTTPYLVTFKGEAQPNAVQVDTFSQASSPQVDILWVIDNDDNGEVQQLVAQNIPSFLQYALSNGIDFHIAVTSDDVCGTSASDDGSFEPCAHCAENGNAAVIVTPQTPDPQGTLQTLINLGTAGGCDDPLFEPAYEALQPGLLSGHNAGFLRPNAYLAVIGVSDADDDSTQSVQFYYNFFESVKGFNSNLFSFSAVNELPSDPPGGSCANGLPYEGGPITRVPQMVQMTGGIEEDICTNDWGTALEQLGNIAFGARTVFPLTAQPANPAAIVVAVAQAQGQPFVTVPMTGQNNAPEWSYNAATNAVDFDPLAAPEPGEVVQVTYGVACN